MRGTENIEHRPALTGLNPCITVFPGHPDHPVVQVDLQPDRKKPTGHLFIPQSKVPTEVLEQIQRGQIEALVLNDPAGPWEIIDVQLRPESGGR
ncbi:MAG: hypothetical protein HYU49_01130 [Candidatus Levybacteria bacterium]|nr:hypothetical protein [Candidatus Levybacteria bacterium]